MTEGLSILQRLHLPYDTVMAKSNGLDVRVKQGGWIQLKSGTTCVYTTLDGRSCTDPEQLEAILEKYDHIRNWNLLMSRELNE